MDKLLFFSKKIISWYLDHGRVFPWRDGSTMYQRVIAEVLLQRTKAETVAKYYQGFIDQFPSWEVLAAADIQKLQDHLKPLGLYRQRASSLTRLAQAITVAGCLPARRKQIDALPGVGQYIANAIELLCHGKKKPLVDVNMARVLERFFGKRKLADIRYDPYLQELAHRVVNTRKAREINFAILDFAATVCTVRNPKCSICPLATQCTFFLAR